ncbi:MAG: hypothetical protein KAW41_01485 [Candidatus Diapherotrites archaeon]|nr:hypothetical protein [Candidatus Diapherotrites archaeon]
MSEGSILDRIDGLCEDKKVVAELKKGLGEGPPRERKSWDWRAGRTSAV